MHAHIACLLTMLLAAGAAAGQFLPPVPVPPGNPVTLAKARLGKVLFWDEQLSSSRTVACGTCHIMAAGGSDPRSLLGGAAGAAHPGADGLFGTADDVRGSPGVVSSVADGHYLMAQPFPLLPQVTPRKAPSVINAAFNSVQFWDGRAKGTFIDPLTNLVLMPFGASLETQALGPPLSSVEMAHEERSWEQVVDRLATVQPLALAQDIGDELLLWIGGRSYPELFAEAFEGAGISPAALAMAIATYERTLISDQAPIDALAAGNLLALSPTEHLGFDIFNGQGKCSLCHLAPTFTDGLFFNIGVRPPEEDPGLGGVTGLPLDMGKFKVPSLRNVGLRAPYFHNGGMQTLAEVVEFYDRGGDFHVNQTVFIQPLGLDPIEKSWLVDFLQHALTDARVASEQPPFDRPKLYAESDRVPVVLPPGSAGSGGAEPRMVALEPALLGSGGCTIGVADGLGGAPAFLAVSLSEAPPGLQVAGVPLHVGPALLQLHAIGVLEGLGAGAGFTSLTRSIPPDPVADGAVVFAQWLILDPQAAGGFAASAGARYVLFSGLDTTAP